MSAPQSRPTISKELIFFLIPLLGSALAVTYDVGFFSAIGLENFAFFSLSEHIVFALGFFPFALLIAFAFAVLALIYARTPITHPKTEPVTRGLERFWSGVAFLLGVLLVVGLWLAFVIVQSRLNETTIIYSIVALMFLSGVTFRQRLGDAISAGLILASAMILAFTFGNLRAGSILTGEGGVFQQGSKTIETKRLGQIEARILNSGNRECYFLI